MESPRPSSANHAVKLFLPTDSVQSKELKSCFEDWNELEQEFMQLEVSQILQFCSLVQL